MSAPTVLYHTQNSWIAQLIPAQSMDSCAMYGSTDCAAQSMDCADPQIAPNIYRSESRFRSLGATPTEPKVELRMRGDRL